MNRLRLKAAVAVAVIGLIVAVGAESGALASSPSASKRAISTKLTVSPVLYRVFTVLRYHRAHAHGAAVDANAQSLPGFVANDMERTGVDVSAAVFAGGTYPTWVIPGAKNVCLVVDATEGQSVAKDPGGWGAVCGSVTGATERGIALTTENATGAPIVVGLAPNGNGTVKVTNTDGTAEEQQVVNNVYEVTKDVPRTVSLRGSTGALMTRDVALPTPPPSPAPSGSTNP